MQLGWLKIIFCFTCERVHQPPSLFFFNKKYVICYRFKKKNVSGNKFPAYLWLTHVVILILSEWSPILLHFTSDLGSPWSDVDLISEKPDLIWSQGPCLCFWRDPHVTLWQSQSPEAAWGCENGLEVPWCRRFLSTLVSLYFAHNRSSMNICFVK